MQLSSTPVSFPMGEGRGAGTVVVSVPPDYVVWSIASIFYGNPCCLGLIAYYFSIQSRDRKAVGDMIGAKMYGSKAYYLNGIALVLIIISIISCIVLVQAKQGKTG